MKDWDQGERLKTIKHVADTARTAGSRLVAEGMRDEAVALLGDALDAVRILATGSPEEIEADKPRISKYLSTDGRA